MYRGLLCISLFFLIQFSLSAQSRFGVSTGFALDINNQGRFKHIPLSIQWLAGEPDRGQFMVHIEGNIPLIHKSSDSAYTLQAGLAPAIAVPKEIRSNVFYVAMGYRFYFFPNAETKVFLDVLPIGYSVQRFRVRYKNYNDNQYEILNPDVNLRSSGLTAGIGLGYESGPWFARAQVVSPNLELSNNNTKYELSYNRASLFHITVGRFLSSVTKKKK